MGQFDWTPEVYLERIRAEIPRYDELQDQAVAAIPFSPERVLELGMGTGETTRRLIEAHPEAWVVGLDASPDMVFRARQTYDDVQLARMEDPLPDGPWDLVISVLSVNQLNDEQKQNLCRRVKEQSRSLVIGDVFDGDQLENLVSWCGGEVDLASQSDLAVRPSALASRSSDRAGWTAPRPSSPLPFRDRWPSRRRELPAPAATSGAPTTRPARPRLNSCPRCHSPRLPHRVCPTCGTYAGREVDLAQSRRAAGDAPPTPSSRGAGARRHRRPRRLRRRAGLRRARRGRPAGRRRRDRRARLRAAERARPRRRRRASRSSRPTEWIGNDEDPVPAVRAKKEASVVRAARDVAEGARRRDGQPRLDRGDDGRRDLRPAPAQGRAAPGPGGAAAGPRQAGALPRRRRQRRGPRPAPGPVRLPRRRLQRGGARRRAPARRPALGRRGGGQGARGGGRGPRDPLRRARDRVRRQRRGPRPAGRRAPTSSSPTASPATSP